MPNKFTGRFIFTVIEKTKKRINPFANPNSINKTIIRKDSI